MVIFLEERGKRAREDLEKAKGLIERVMQDTRIEIDGYKHEIEVREKEIIEREAEINLPSIAKGRMLQLYTVVDGGVSLRYYSSWESVSGTYSNPMLGRPISLEETKTKLGKDNLSRLMNNGKLLAVEGIGPVDIEQEKVVLNVEICDKFIDLRSRYEKQIDELRKNIARVQDNVREKTSDLVAKARELEFEINGIDKCRSIRGMTPQVGKNDDALGTNYSLWINGQRVFYLNNSLSYLHSPRKNQPLALRETLPSHALSELDMETLEVLAAENGDYITGSGLCLTGHAREQAERIFNHVRNGVQILPSSEPSGYKIINSKGNSGSNQDKKIRTWGQIHLLEHGPNEEIPGQIFGSGEYFIAYHFGDRVVAEANIEAQGTYVFTAESFDTLRRLNRETLLKERPDGFLGRIIHNGNREKWKARVEDYLTMPLKNN